MNKGQTLVEGILAIFIILIGVVGMLMLGVSSLFGSVESLDQVKAMNFAREALEVIRNKRDSNWLASIDYNTGFDPYEDPEILIGHARLNFINGVWSIDQVESAVFDPQILGPIECEPTCQLFFHPLSSGLYNHSDAIDGQATNFYRVVEFNEICYIDPGSFVPPFPLSDLAGGFRVKPNVNEEPGKGWCKDDWELDPQDSYESGIQVLVKVGWQEKSQFRTITLEDRIYDWK